ncbi:MAG: TolC family protein [Verrucomicrobiota bacterium]|nr:TolC family protein [Verrucomicrobiota bacterium]
MRIILCFLFMLLLVSCTTYKPVTEFKDVSKYSERQKTKTNIMPDTSKIFSTEQAIEIAIKNNPDFIATKYAMIAALQRYKQSTSTYYPSVSISHNISHTHFTPHYTRNAITNKYEERARVSAIKTEWLIYDGLVRKMNALSAKHAAKNMEYLNKNSKRLLILFVTNAYNSIMLSKEQIRIALGDYDFNNKLLKETNIKYNVGSVSLTEVLNFETKLNSAKNALIAAEHSFSTFKFILAELLGLKDGKMPKAIKFPDLEINDSVELLEIEDCLDTALMQRPDLEANRESFKSAKYSLKSAYGSFYPKISFNGTLGYTHDKDEYSDYSSIQDSDVNSFGINMSWDLFTGFSRLAAMKEAKAFANQKEYELIEKWLSVVSEVRQSYDNCQKNIKQLAIYQANLKVVKKTRDLVREEYKSGNTSITRLNEVQRDLITAEGNSSSAIINLKNAYIQLKTATGSIQ